LQRSAKVSVFFEPAHAVSLSQNAWPPLLATFAGTERQIPSIRSSVSDPRSRPLWPVLAATVLVTGGYMATFSYISPLLTDRTDLPAGAVPLILVGFGVGSSSAPTPPDARAPFRHRGTKQHRVSEGRSTLDLS
jgi:hypothetical protein